MNAKIALIEDEPEIRKLLRTFLEQNGCTVSEAADGNAASAMLAAEAFDLILPGAGFLPMWSVHP